MTTAQWLRAACRRIGRGSGYLCWTLGRRGAGAGRRWAAGIRGWLGAASGWEWCLRAAILLVLALVARKIGGGLLGTLAAHSDRLALLLWPITIGWCIAAYRTHNRARSKADPKQDAADTPANEIDEGLSTAEFVEHLRTAIGDARGAHLTVLAEHLTKATGAEWTTAFVRSACKTASVPVVDGVRMPGRSPSTGVRREALPDPSPPASESGVGGVGTAGQVSPTGAPTPTPTGPAPTRWRFEEDPTNLHRTHVIYPTERTP
ncbi:hypothetical protein [Streptomyces sp. NPDC048442]|uniref:hypothetical protein n=1 Tax=Streptomyces sp. NPDC048442 TaxID=3154823 RepID=UPI0034404434